MTSENRREVDLIWFPTGGGKTGLFRRYRFSSFLSETSWANEKRHLCFNECTLGY